MLAKCRLISVAQSLAFNSANTTLYSDDGKTLSWLSCARTLFGVVAVKDAGAFSPGLLLGSSSL